MSLSYADYCDYYSKKCLYCRGDKRILDNRKVWVSCSCQRIASCKWRLEQIPVHPSSLKYKEWNDFTGSIGNDTITSLLTAESLIEAKTKAMEYCFGEAGLSGPLNRKENLIINHRIHNGLNIVITGDKSSGKSLLACLIAKEAIRDNLSVKWIVFSALCNGARWDTHKTIDHDFFDFLANTQLLVIEDIDLEAGYYGDIFVLDKFFHHRYNPGLATIFLCSRKLLQTIQTSPWVIEEKLGKSFVSLVTDSKNVVIDLVLQK